MVDANARAMLPFTHGIDGKLGGAIRAVLGLPKVAQERGGVRQIFSQCARNSATKLPARKGLSCAMWSPTSSRSISARGVISHCMSELGESPAVRIWLADDQTRVTHQVPRHWPCLRRYRFSALGVGWPAGARCHRAIAVQHGRLRWRCCRGPLSTWWRMKVSKSGLRATLMGMTPSWQLITINSYQLARLAKIDRIPEEKTPQPCVQMMNLI